MGNKGTKIEEWEVIEPVMILELHLCKASIVYDGKNHRQCGNRPYINGYCTLHYERLKRLSDTTSTKPPDGNGK